MKKRFAFLAALVLLIPLFSGCSNPQKVTLGTLFTLAPGQSVHIDSESINIRFIGETADSRCPTGVNCIWAGEVRVEIKIDQKGRENRVTLTDTAGSGLSTGYTYQNYKITFSVDPYPEADKTIPKADYRLSMTISKLVN